LTFGKNIYAKEKSTHWPATMARRYSCFLAILSMLVCSFVSADDTYVASLEESWANAQKNYAKGQYQSAFSDFYWAAIRDHPQSQQMVGLMYLLGTEAFGVGVKRDRVEAEFWLGQAQIHGIDVNAHLRCAITRRASERNIPVADRAFPCFVASAKERPSSVSTKAPPALGIESKGRR
jgi:TPR repeat protein